MHPSSSEMKGSNPTSKKGDAQLDLTRLEVFSIRRSAQIRSVLAAAGAMFSLPEHTLFFDDLVASMKPDSIAIDHRARRSVLAQDDGILANVPGSGALHESLMLSG